LAAGRAALAASLAGDIVAAQRDLAGAAAMVPGAAPRGLSVLLAGVEATLAAVRGEFAAAARRLAGLAVARVQADPLAAEGWADLAVTATVAGGNDAMAWDMLTAPGNRPLTTRQVLIKAWLDLRAGRLADARAGLVSVGDESVLRRDGLLAATVTAGLVRRAGDEAGLRVAWHQVAPVVAGADVEPLLLDAWGELSVAAAQVAPVDAELIVAAMAEAATRAGDPPWSTATLAWWALQRAAATQAEAIAREAADQLAVLAGKDPADEKLNARSGAARAWVSVLSGRPDARAVRAAAEALARTGCPWEAAALCGAAAAQVTEPAAARDLLATGRVLRASVVPEDRGAAGGLSEREREVGELLLDGLTQKEIGARLYISPKTVEQHVARLRQKLDASNRAELVAALRARLTS
ncbi:MAG: helix-turn-helix transcriptional regulator, partial [Micromonosporaceae bacterium]|nr:helix-turn-helix transcriptional regulator [Micromonosporaceae bacterium]